MSPTPPPGKHAKASEGQEVWEKLPWPVPPARRDRAAWQGNVAVSMFKTQTMSTFGVA